MQVDGKVALITGSSRGVGQATALQLAAMGCSIIINHRDSQAQAETTLEAIRAMGGKAMVVQADVSREGACQDLVRASVEAWGRLDILINNAATTDFLPFADLDALEEDHWDRVLQTNIKGPFYMIRSARPWLEKAPGGGEIINITSIAGLTGNGSSLAYCASKAALINMTLSMARILAPRVRVNAVAPGFIADHWTREGLGGGYESALNGHASKSVLGAVCEPDDVARAVVSIITGSDLVTGQNLVCDAGAMIGPRA